MGERGNVAGPQAADGRADPRVHTGQPQLCQVRVHGVTHERVHKPDAPRPRLGQQPGDDAGLEPGYDAILVGIGRVHEQLDIGFLTHRGGAWRSAPSAATAPPLVSALAEHRTALLDHLHDEEENILPLIAEHLTAPEWARLGERFAEEVPRSKILFFLGMILEDADPAERQAMMANLPAPARFAWKAFGQRQFRRRVSKIRAGPGRAVAGPVQRFRPGVTRVGRAGRGSRASTAGAGRPSHGGEASWPPRPRSRRAAT